jgi:hypothetical protein
MKLLIGCMLQKGAEPYNIVLQQILLGGTYVARVTISSRSIVMAMDLLTDENPKWLVAFYHILSDI